VALAVESGDDVARIMSDRALVRRVDDSNRYFELELADGADPQALLRRLIESGVAVQRFELVQPSLHRIFLDKVGASGIEEGMTGQG
jgi:ABC-2 type transport system ATP-binding protein